MFDTFFEKYQDFFILEKPAADCIDNYSGKLPAQLIQFWTTFGFGTFMNGYLKIVNPSDYQPVFEEAYDNKDNEIVFAVTGLGDFLTWTGDAIRAVYFKNGFDSIIESGDDMEWFFNMDLADAGFLKANLDDKNYMAAKQRLGEPAFDECFGYVPLPGSGGVEKPENLQLVKTKEHIFLITQMLGKIG